MGSLIAVIIIVCGVLGSAFSKILADEFKAWRPNIVRRVIGIAASLLSDVDRDRYHEEWSAYLEEVPGDLGKLISASGFVFAALRMSDRRLVALGAKRAVDISMAVTSLVLLTPPILLAALAIKIESPGPIFFAQRRIGKDGKEFGLLKFRTMRTDAAEKLAELLLTDPSARAEWETTRKLKNDPRITIVGRILRKTSIDELPQLVNILRGEMSVVGPRALPSDSQANKEKAKMLRLRQRMRPGLTGIGQLLRPTGDSRSQAAVVSDLLYVMKHSIALDVSILFKTALRVFSDPETSLTAAAVAFVVFLVPLGIVIG
ncbi:sugar transferase, partial [Rhizobium ruizarguesonis]